MAITLQQIADAAGVSRATVDRALKNRGRVNKDLAKRIKKIAKDMNYHPNSAARELALAKNPVKIGVILSSINTPFMAKVLGGVQAAKEEVEQRGGVVDIRTVYGVNGDQIIQHIEEFRDEGVNGIALVPAWDPRIKPIIDTLAEENNIPVVTFNSDVSDSKRICFVGQDNKRAGQVAAGLLAEILAKDSKVCVMSGLAKNPGMRSRTEGFVEAINEIRPDVEILQICYVNDENDNEESKSIALKILTDHPDISGIYACTPAVSGVCNALYKKKRAGEIKLVSHDVLDENIRNLQAGTINFLIGQEAYVQGYEPVMILFRRFVEETELEKGYEYTRIIIKNRFNI